MYDLIKDRLKNIGKTQKQLAEHLKIAPPHLSAIFKGIRRIQPAEIPLIAEFLGYNLESFVKYVTGQEIEDDELRAINVQQVYRIGFVEAGAWTEAAQLPQDEWQPVNYPINDNLKGRNIFALGVRGNSMNKIFPPERTTLICLSIEDYCDLVKEGIQNGDFVVAQRVSNDGKYEATVKRYNRLDDNTVVLEAMSSDPRYTNIIVGSENCEYQIIAVVIDYQTKLKDL